MHVLNHLVEDSLFLVLVNDSPSILLRTKHLEGTLFAGGLSCVAAV